MKCEKYILKIIYLYKFKLNNIISFVIKFGYSMKISNINNKNSSNNNGFTLVELAVVIAGLASLSAIAIPNVLTSMRLNKIEEAKAIMNGYAISCINKVRENPQKYNEERFEDLDEVKLKTLGYKIVDDKTKCDEIGIKPIKENEKNFYPFGFTLYNNGVFFKTATPPLGNNERFILSCQRWAGEGCSLSPERQAKMAADEALRQEKLSCESDADKWIRETGEGQYRTWDDDTNRCDKEFCAFEGTITPCEDLQSQIDEREKRLLGEKCVNWANNEALKSNSLPLEEQSPDPQTKDFCNGEQFCFHTGDKFKSQEEWN